MEEYSKNPYLQLMIYTVYILLCRDGSYYTGITNDLERRLWEHETGCDPKAYTFRRRPLKLVFHEDFRDVNRAIDFEKQIKGWRREKKEALINGRWDLLPELSVNYTKKKSYGDQMSDGSIGRST